MGGLDQAEQKSFGCCTPRCAAILAKKSSRRDTESAMPSRASKPKRPRDPDLLARSVVEELIGETIEGKPLPQGRAEHEKNPAAVALSKLGASKGGTARALALSANQRSTRPSAEKRIPQQTLRHFARNRRMPGGDTQGVLDRRRNSEEQVFGARRRDYL